MSNTTEAGICFNEKDDINEFEGITYPAKPTKFLFERFNAGLDGLYMMPVELIDNNADELFKCVLIYIELWNLPKKFKAWIEKDNYFCNPIVDRIVSGYPRDEETKQHFTDLIGKEDEHLTAYNVFADEVKNNVKAILSGTTELR